MWRLAARRTAIFGPGRAFRQELSGDGHTAMRTKLMNASEDNKFRYKFTFIDTDERRDS